MTRAWDYMPGAPAAGHVTAAGSWHPGGRNVCHRCELDRRCPDCGALVGRKCRDADGKNMWTSHPGRQS
jgi:hypothetical protein